MKEAQYSIDKAIFSFSFESRSVASRCNNVIESIFETHIAPELEKAITAKIPIELSIQLESLEIDIGTINEKELQTELAKRVKTALKEALQIALNDKHGGFPRNDVSSSSKPNEYFILALEIYLTKGYFPSWWLMEREISFEQIIASLIKSSQNDLKQMIKKHSSNESAMKRLYSIKINAIDKRTNLFEQEEILNMESFENIEDPLDEIGAEIKIYNSGLIIFWPFLMRYFEQLALVQNGEFLNDLSRNRSVFLLQQLVYGGINFPEHELSLNKLLVGLNLKRHLSAIAELSTKEKDLSLSLLNGLMSNWDKVKNSSIEGIRETFLQREGIIHIKNDSYVLRIEKKGVDILLNSLPWNISLIKIPWMQKPMHVEWI